MWINNYLPILSMKILRQTHLTVITTHARVLGWPWWIAMSCLTSAFGREPPVYTPGAAAVPLLPVHRGALRGTGLIFWCAGFALPLGNGILTGALSQHIEPHMKLSLSLAAWRVSSIPRGDARWGFILKPHQETGVLGKRTALSTFPKNKPSGRTRAGQQSGAISQ